MLVTPGLDVIVSRLPGALGNGIDDFVGAVLLETKLDRLSISRDFDVETSRTKAPVTIGVLVPAITIDGLWVFVLTPPLGDTITDRLWILVLTPPLRLGLRIFSSLGLTRARSFRSVSARNHG